MRATVVFILVAMLGAVAAPLAVHADDDNPFDGREAGEAFESGRIAPLQSLLVSAAIGLGSVIEVELEHEHGRWIYEVDMLRPNGRIEHVDVDAHTLERLLDHARERD